MRDVRQANLFGGDDPVVSPMRGHGYFTEWKLAHLYRRADGEEHCGNCGRSYLVRAGKQYRKCALMGESGSAASDVSSRHVCACWVFLAYGGDDGILDK